MKKTVLLVAMAVVAILVMTGCGRGKSQELIEKQEKQIATLQAEKTTLERQIITLGVSNSAMNNIINSLNQTNAALNGQVATLLAEKAAIEKETRTLQTNNAAINDQIAALQAENSTLKGQAGTLQSEKANSRVRVMALEVENKELKSQVSALSALTNAPAPTTPAPTTTTSTNAAPAGINSGVQINFISVGGGGIRFSTNGIAGGFDSLFQNPTTIALTVTVITVEGYKYTFNMKDDETVSLKFPPGKYSYDWVAEGDPVVYHSSSPFEVSKNATHYYREKGMAFHGGVIFRGK